MDEQNLTIHDRQSTEQAADSAIINGRSATLLARQVNNNNRSTCCGGHFEHTLVRNVPIVAGCPQGNTPSDNKSIDLICQSVTGTRM